MWKIMNDEVKISYLAANVSVYQIHVILHSFLALFNELNFSRKLHLIITCTWTKDKKIFVKFWSHSTPSKDHLFQKVEFLVNFCYIWPLNLSKYGSNQLELVDILYAITFHSITVNRDHWVSLKVVALLERVIFYNKNRNLQSQIYSLKLVSTSWC